MTNRMSLGKRGVMRDSNLERANPRLSWKVASAIRANMSQEPECRGNRFADSTETDPADDNNYLYGDVLNHG